MKHLVKSTMRVLALCIAITVLVLCLLADCKPSLGGVGLTLLFRELSGIIRSNDTQWLVMFAAFAYFCTFTFIWRAFQGGRFWRFNNPDVWCMAVMILALTSYAADYSITSGSTQAVVFVGCCALAKAFKVCIYESMRRKSKTFVMVLLLFLLLLLTVLALPWSARSDVGATYRGAARWSGLFENANLFGLLMVAGMLLAIGFFFLGSVLIPSSNTLKLRLGGCFLACFGFIAASLMLIGLFHSYSRGAWIALVVGLIYGALELKNLRSRSSSTCWLRGGACDKPQEAELRPLNETDHTKYSLASKPDAYFAWFQGNAVWWPILMASLALLTVNHFQQTQMPMLRRVISVADINDFSWRNRISAWEGALQIIAEHPWCGTEWNQPERRYQYYYRPSQITAGGAIEMNDYLMLGAALGLPALFAYVLFLWFSLKGSAYCGKLHFLKEKKVRREIEDGNAALPYGQFDYLKVIFHTGAAALMVGFWFDGGLFKLSTATIFWILLELGSLEPRGHSKDLPDQVATVL